LSNEIAELRKITKDLKNHTKDLIQMARDFQDRYHGSLEENKRLMKRSALIKDYVLDRWVDGRLWDELEKELSEKGYDNE